MYIAKVTSRKREREKKWERRDEEMKKLYDKVFTGSWAFRKILNLLNLKFMINLINLN